MVKMALVMSIVNHVFNVMINFNSFHSTARLKLMVDDSLHGLVNTLAVLKLISYVHDWGQEENSKRQPKFVEKNHPEISIFLQNRIPHRYKYL